MDLRYIDWIWHIRGSLPLPPVQSNDQAFDRLDPLFRQFGTSRERTSEMLVFNKKDQAAQDKMSVFDSGVLQIEQSSAGRVLRYNLSSKILLFCFLAPLMFLAFAQATKYLVRFEAHRAELVEKSNKASGAVKKPEKKQLVPHLSPIDKFLGAPAPELKKDKEDGDGSEEGGKKSSPTPAYVFACIFATLYVVGRILESRRVKSLFKKLVDEDYT